MSPVTAADDNEPTNPKLWEKCKAKAKSRYTKWPSAYAVGHALKLYKDEGGKWKKTAGESTKIDPAWVKGIRAWVKKTFAPKARYASLADLIAHFKTLRDKDLNRFWEYLFFTKGLLPRGMDPSSIFETLRVKVRDELKAARELLDNELSRYQHTLDAMTPGTRTYDMDQRQAPEWTVLWFYKQINPDDPFAAALRGYEEVAKETLAKVEDILSGKLLRAITAFLGKYGGGSSYDPDEVLLEYNIGNVKLVYDGEPDRNLITRPDPADPRGLSEYIPFFKKAKALLDQKGFGDLWYGPVFVGCPKCGGENKHGKHLGVGAHYMIGPDHVVVYVEPQTYIVELLIHELGHRYYYKFMDRADRLRFDSFFKEVVAVSEYGSKATEEDFAEVFAHFVLGRDMTRDQIERFKAFLAKKDRGRFAAEQKFKMPRKFDKAHCESKTCDEMGFTEKASCRPYKNCYRGASDGRIAAISAMLPASVLYGTGWEWDEEGFANWPKFLKKPKSEQVEWAKEYAKGGIREPVDVTVYSDGTAKFEDGHHRIMAGTLLGVEIPVRVSFRGFDAKSWPDLLNLLKAGYTKRDYNPQGWNLKRSGVPPLEVVRQGPRAADEWIVVANEATSSARVAFRYLAAKGKAKKDVGHGGLDEWFSGHGEGKSKQPGKAQWGDWVAISPVKRTITREDGTKKTYEPGDILGPCGDFTDDPEWKDLTRGGKTPFKCMARPKAHDMPKDERAEKAREKMKVQEEAPKGKKPVFTPTFKDNEE